MDNFILSLYSFELWHCEIESGLDEFRKDSAVPGFGGIENLWDLAQHFALLWRRSHW
jgi:hypothetical protein